MISQALIFRSTPWMAFFLFVASAATTSADIWINEIQYNNVNDENQFVEVVIPLGTLLPPDLGTISIELYDSSGMSYEIITLSNPLIHVTSDTFANFYVWNPEDILNDVGAIALSIGLSNEQFLSYGRGTPIMAVNGTAQGETSTDIGFVQDNTTPLNQSIGLVGVGTTFSDFGWSAPMGWTSGSINEGQFWTGTAIPEPGGLVFLLVAVPVLATRRKRS